MIIGHSENIGFFLAPTQFIHHIFQTIGEYFEKKNEVMFLRQFLQMCSCRSFNTIVI